MKRLIAIASVLTVGAVLAAGAALAGGSGPSVRVVHASPDAPARERSSARMPGGPERVGRGTDGLIGEELRNGGKR